LKLFLQERFFLDLPLLRADERPGLYTRRLDGLGNSSLDAVHEIGAGQEVFKDAPVHASDFADELDLGALDREKF